MCTIPHHNNKPNSKEEGAATTKAGDVEDEAEVAEDEETQQRTPTSLRGSITSYTASHAATMWTIQERTAHTQRETSTSTTSNVTRRIYTPTKEHAWWHNTNPYQMEKVAEWHG